jgi:cell division protein FtsI (penicillin-binding protein 3)
LKPFGPAHTFAVRGQIAAPRFVEAAPARNRVRFLAIGVFVVLMLLAGRAVQLAFAGDPLAQTQRAETAPPARADLVDRNGVLLATTVRAFALTAQPQRVANAPETAAALARLFPDMERATTIRRLTDSTRQLVYLRRGLTPHQREQVQALNLGGIGFRAEDRRTYPNGSLAAHVLGFTGVDLNSLGGVELGLDSAIRAAAAEGRAVQLSLDVRVQYALETELAAAARAAHASGGAAILLDGRTGETYAFASWPSYDANNFAETGDDARRDRVAGMVRELGSTMKPFTLAMALEQGATTAGEVFDVSRPFEIDGHAITDHEQILGPVTLREILARSSNIGAARLALRVGGARQRAALERLGLTQPSRLEVAFNEAPIAPSARGRGDVASLGFGYGLAATPAALAGAYTVFVNGGARVTPTLVARAPDAPVQRTQVFTPEATRQVLGFLRTAVTQGTGRAADVPGLAVAGKTGTAEIWGGADGYDQSRNFSSFAGVFPANNPRYVIVLALDGVGEGAAGGAVAAPAVARTLRRVAPMLGLRVTAAPG